MAKSKRKRAGSTRPSSSGRTATKSPTGSDAAPQPVRPEPATPGGPNRLERKEAARKAREAMRRREARMRVLKRIGTVAVVGGVITAIVFFAVQGGGKKLNDTEKQLLSQAKDAAVTAGCGAVQDVQPYDPESEDRAHIGPTSSVTAMPPLSSYRTQPPTSGPHNQTPLASGVYFDPVQVDMSIHSLEHGAVIVWVAPDVNSDDLTNLQTFFQSDDESSKVIVAPYNYPDQGAAGQLPAGKQMVLVAWHRLQTCDTVSLPVAFQFVANYRSQPSISYKGVAPEPGTPIDPVA
jgi:Protein of unknown function (DUF3105)